MLTQPQQLFLGLRMGVRQNGLRFLTEPVATQSTKPESQAAEIARKKAKQAEAADEIPCSGTLVRAVVLDAAGEVVFDVHADANSPDGHASYSLLNYLDVSGALITPPSWGYATAAVRLFGYKLGTRMPLMWLEARRYRRALQLDVDMPPGLCYHRPFEAPYVDSFDAVIPSTMRDHLSWESLAAFLGVQDWPADCETDPLAQAQAVRLLAMAVGLCERKPGEE